MKPNNINLNIKKIVALNKKIFILILNITETQTEVIFDFNMGNIDCNVYTQSGAKRETKLA